MPFEATLDVVIEGVGAVRDCPVRLAGSRLQVGDRAVSVDELLGVARRSSVLLVVALDCALAIRGESTKLAPLAAELARHADRTRENVQSLQAVGGEAPIFFGPAAVAGRVGSKALRGFMLVVGTRRGLVFAGRTVTTLDWERISEFEVKMGSFGPVVRIGGHEMRLELVYLGDAQIQTMRRMTQGKPPTEAAAPSDAPARTARPSARRPARRPTAPPQNTVDLRFRVPELKTALAGSGGMQERSLTEMARALSGPPLRPDFMEDHLREVRNVLSEPVARRRREAAGSDTFAAAALALDGRALWNETVAALDHVARTTQNAFESQVRRLAAQRKLTQRQAMRFMPRADAEAAFRERLTRTVSGLQRACDALAEVSLRIRETAALGSEGLEKLHDQWHEALGAFDRAFGQAWVQVGGAVLQWWEESLWPHLRKLALEKPRRGPSWLKFLGG